MSMGVLLANAVSGNGRIADLKALAAFRSGQIKFDGLKAYYEKKGILLLSAESMEDRVILKSGDNPIHMIGIERQLGNLQETAKKIPLERMLIESEAPFMIPAVHRGKRNKPSFIKDTAAFIAETREAPLEEISEILYANSCRFFGVSE